MERLPAHPQQFCAPSNMEENTMEMTGWRPAGTSEDERWEWSHTMEELLLCIRMPVSATLDQVIVQVTQKNAELVVRLDMNSKESHEGYEFPTSCKVTCEWGRGVSGKQSSWRLSQELLMRPASMHRFAPREKAHMVNIRLKKVDKDQDNLNGVEFETVHSPSEQLQETIDHLRKVTFSEDANDLGGFWAYPKDALDDPRLENKTHLINMSTCADSQRSVTTDFSHLLSSTADYQRRPIGAGRPIREEVASKESPRGTSLDLPGHPQIHERSPSAKKDLYDAIEYKLNKHDQHNEYEPYTDAELSAYDLEGITQPQAATKSEKNDMFFFEDDTNSGWYGVGYGSYATTTRSSGDRRALFEDIMRQAEDNHN